MLVTDGGSEWLGEDRGETYDGDDTVWLEKGVQVLEEFVGE